MVNVSVTVVMRQVSGAVVKLIHGSVGGKARIPGYDHWRSHATTGRV